MINFIRQVRLKTDPKALKYTISSEKEKKQIREEDLLIDFRGLWVA